MSVPGCGAPRRDLGEQARVDLLGLRLQALERLAATEEDGELQLRASRRGEQVTQAVVQRPALG